MTTTFRTTLKRKQTKADIGVDHEIECHWVEEVTDRTTVDFLDCRTLEPTGGLFDTDFELLVTRLMPEWEIQKLLLICRLVHIGRMYL